MQTDYMMRMIEQAGSVIAAMVFKQRGAELAEASQDIDATCLNTVGLKLETVKRMTPVALAEHLAMSGANRIPRSVLLAELLLRDAESAKSVGHSQSAVLAEAHAFCLLRDSIDFLSPEEQADYHPKLCTLAARFSSITTKQTKIL